MLTLAFVLAIATPDETVSIAPVAKKLAIYGDGKGHYVVAVPFPTSDERDYLFYGDGKTFWQQRSESRFVNGKESFSVQFWEPRGEHHASGSFSVRDGKANIQCDDRTVEITRLGAEETAAMLASARFLRPRWRHEPYALARDAAGKYYYVDKPREPQNNRNFRLFAGRRGALKPLKLTNVVSDSAGDVFVTRGGQLRLSADESSWAEGKRQTKLTVMPVDDNAGLIYRELGVYVGQSLGTPCDDL
jgi:hypothetical protein